MIKAEPPYILLDGGFRLEAGMSIEPNRFACVERTAEPFNWEIHDNANGIILGNVTGQADAELITKYLNTMWVCVTNLDSLIGNSDGVYGYHLNGDVAPWDELIDSDCLGSYADAIKL